ncbi:MAG TPA: hypothetical protein VGM37_03580 [Armatimonadota bacterium]
MNVDCARSQDAYLTRIREAAHGLRTGAPSVGCPREGCAECLAGSLSGDLLTLRCPSCGLIFRGSHARLMEYYE